MRQSGMRAVIGTPSMYTPSRMLADYPPESLKKGEYFVSVYEDRTLIASAWIKAPAESYVIRQVFVLPEYRGKGIGRFLMEHILAHLKPKAKPIVLYVDPANTPAINLYKSLGFVLHKTGSRFGDMYILG